MEHPDELSCQELVELVTDYLEGALTPTMLALVRAHLDSCRGCRRYLEQIRQTIELLGQLPDEGITPEAQEELLRAFHDWKTSRAGSPPQSF